MILKQEKGIVNWTWTWTMRYLTIHKLTFVLIIDMLFNWM